MSHQTIIILSQWGSCADMYAVGKDDPPAQSASAKDARRDKEIDAQLKDPWPLPSHLKHHARKTSRVDVDVPLHLPSRVYVTTDAAISDALRRHADRCFLTVVIHPPELHSVLRRS